MTATGEQLATSFEKANDELIKAVSALTDEQWRTATAAEGWSVGVTAHHVVASREHVMHIVRLLATSPATVEFTQQMLNDSNAEHAKQFSGASRAETLELARTSGSKVAAELRGMSDDALAQGGEMSGFGRRMTAADMVEGALTGHALGHLESIRTTTSV